MKSPSGALTALCLSLLLSSLGTSIANVSLPTLAAAFSASVAQVQWVVLAYLLANTTLIVVLGRLGDHIGHKRLLLIGLTVFTAASVGCAVAPSLGWLIAARAVQGAGGAVLMALSLAMVTETGVSAGRAMGLLGAMSSAGTALGPALGGLLLAWWGWRAVFAVTVPLGLLALALASRALPDHRAPRAAPARVSANLWPGLAGSFLVAAVAMTTMIVGPFYLSGPLALNPALVGLVLAVGPVVAALTGVPAGRLTDRWGAPAVSRLGLSGMIGGAVLLSLLSEAAGVAGYVGPLALLTAGYALFQTANNTTVMAGVDPARRGTVSGLLNLSRSLGLIAGAGGLGTVFAVSGIRITFAAVAVLVAGALLLVQKRRSTLPTSR